MEFLNVKCLVTLNIIQTFSEVNGSNLVIGLDGKVQLCVICIEMKSDIVEAHKWKIEGTKD